MDCFYTLDGRYVPRTFALAALKSGRSFWCGLRAEARTYDTPKGRLTVWVWPFREES